MEGAPSPIALASSEGTPCEDEGGHHGDASTSQGMPTIASKPPEAT